MKTYYGKSPFWEYFDRIGGVTLFVIWISFICLLLSMPLWADRQPSENEERLEKRCADLERRCDSLQTQIDFICE